MHNLSAIADRLATSGRSPATPVAVIAEGTMPGERVLLSTLDEVGQDIAEHGVAAPAIVVIGDVVAVAHPQRYPLVAVHG